MALQCIPARYQVLKVLGQGAFGVVGHVRDTQTGEEFAIKVMDRRNMTKYVMDEIVNHGRLRHPHIVTFLKVIQSEEAWMIKMEYANNNSLFHEVRARRFLPEADARWYFQQTIMAVDYCHRRGVAIRDIKLENLLLHTEPGLIRSLLKLCDFGFSNDECRSAAKSTVGTPSYMAPEVMKSCGAYYDAKAADVWSCGVVLYVMLYGFYPFDPRQGETQQSEMQKQKLMLDRMENQDYILNPDIGVSENCLDLLVGLLRPDPHYRKTIPEIMDHPWFTDDLPAEARTMNDYYVKSQKEGGRYPWLE